MKPIPPVSKYMTSMPHSIGKDQSIVRAKHVMQDLHVRHLPVLDAGRLVGVLSDRDIALIEALRDVEPTSITVEDAMSQPVYSVPPSSPLDAVAEEMAEKRFGSALIVDNGKLVGILTTTDLAAALAELLRTRLA